MFTPFGSLRTGGGFALIYFDLLPFYAILRSIPNKLLGVIFMFAAILILLALPMLDLSNLRGLQFKPISKFFFWMFVANFLSLMVLGSKHVESPFIELGQFCTFFYFAWFLVLVPFSSIGENVLANFGGPSESSK
jgi:ubiquinol-cytochrome c reductase cytochrome b subunit